MSEPMLEAKNMFITAQMFYHGELTPLIIIYDFF